MGRVPLHDPGNGKHVHAWIYPLSSTVIVWFWCYSPIMNIHKFTTLISVILLAAPAGLLAETVRQAATDGMVLNLGNQPQQVEVRAKSIGSSDCHVEFTIQGKTVDVIAPVNKYSEWIKIGPAFLVPTDVKLGVAVKCNDGAITQVQYHK